jgi:hypothetical protein
LRQIEEDCEEVAGMIDTKADAAGDEPEIKEVECMIDTTWIKAMTHDGLNRAEIEEMNHCQSFRVL